MSRHTCTITNHCSTPAWLRIPIWKSCTSVLRSSNLKLFLTPSELSWSNQHHFSFKQEVTPASYQWKPRQEDQENCRKQSGGRDINVFIRPGWCFHTKTATKWRIVTVDTIFSLSICFFHFHLDVEVVGLNNTEAWHAWRDATGFHQLSFCAIIRGLDHFPILTQFQTFYFGLLQDGCVRKKTISEQTFHLVPDQIKEYV